MGLNIQEPVGFSNLSEEVGRVIFEIAALLDPETGRSCALVSKKVNVWIEPILYRTLIIGDATHIQNLCTIIQNPHSTLKPPDFFSRNVKSIAIINDLDQDASSILTLLKSCPNIEILLLWYAPHEYEGCPSDDAALCDFITGPTSPTLSPRRISISTNVLPRAQVHFTYPIFRTVTHVELVWDDRHGESEEVDWTTLQTLHCLTHLSIFPYFPMTLECAQWVGQTISFCPPSLQVFILWLDSPAYFRSNSNDVRRGGEFADVRDIQNGKVDRRAVLGFLGRFTPEAGDVRPIVRSQEEGVRDNAGILDAHGKDFWILAEELVEERLGRGRQGN